MKYERDEVRRVLYVIGSLERGGAEQHVVQVARKLKARGWVPEFFVFSVGGPLTEHLDSEGIPIFSRSMPAWLERLAAFPRIKARLSLLLLITSLTRFLIMRRPLIVHFFLPGSYLIGGLASMLTGTRPRVMSRRSMNNYQKAYPIYARLERFLHPRMDRICGNSFAVIEQLKSEGVRESQLVMLYNGIDLSRFSKVAASNVVRCHLGISSDALVLVIVANLIPYKGHDDLIKALGLIRDELPKPWVCLCVGRDDGILHQLQSRCREVGVHNHFYWLGSRSDVPDLLAASDIGILCSHEEGFSNAVLEGMAAALPLVVTDVGGNSEAVIHGETGLVVPPRNPVALANGILEMVRHPQRNIMGERGRKRVGKLFTLNTCIDNYEYLYNDLIKNNYTGLQNF
jgi:glycosyltransferase involved in cell wall biosynthesis